MSLCSERKPNADEIGAGPQIRVRNEKKNIFVFSQPKHMLLVVKIIVSMRRFFYAPKIHI